MTEADMMKFIVAMIIMTNPLGSLSIFLDLTRRAKPHHQRKIAWQTTVAIITIMLLAVWAGKNFLVLLGITIPAFRFAGGIILLLMGLSMLQSHESAVSHTSEDDTAAKESPSIAIVPMALPVIVGPGAISTLIIASEDFPQSLNRMWMSVICVLLGLTLGIMMYYAAPIAKVIGASIIKAVTRIMGMIIMAIAVSMLSDGLVGLLPALR